MHTIPFANGPTRYEARVKFFLGELLISIHRTSDDLRLFGLYGDPKSTWQRMEAIDDFVPLGVVRRALRIFDEEMVKARAGLSEKGASAMPM